MYAPWMEKQKEEEDVGKRAAGEEAEETQDEDGKMGEMTIEQLKNIGWSPEGIVKGINRLSKAWEEERPAFTLYTQRKRWQLSRIKNV